MCKKLKEWACSFSGCDGGDIKADIWLCGIEWGYSGTTEKDKKEYYQTKLINAIAKGSVENPCKNFSWEDSLKYPYGKSFAKLYKAIQSEKIDDYENVANHKPLFRLNLYPIAFSSTDHSLWQEYNLDKTTGFKSKHLFNTWCFFNRFSFFSKLRKEHKPKLIICTGINYLRDYLMCFGAKNIDQIQTGSIKPKSENNKHDRVYYWIKVDETLLVVTPFLSGRYGLNSDHLLQEMGIKIKELMS